VLPFVIEKLIAVGNRSGLFDKLKANATVSESLDKLDELRRATWKMLVPDPGSSAEVVANNTDAGTPRLPLLLAAPANQERLKTAKKAI